MDRITLGNDEFEGRNNAYVLVAEDSETPPKSREGGEGDDDELALVDTGLATGAIREELRAGLAERGYEFSDIDDIVLSHFHVDHAGLAGEIQAKSGATVYVHEADAPLVEQDPDAVAALEERRQAYLDQWDVPDDAQESLLDFLERAAHLEGEPADVTPIEDGDRLAVGGRVLETIHTPGHSAGLCCFETEAADEAFVGDAVLPVYTPNVGGADVRVERPLEKYLTTLRQLADREYDRLWPGHRDPIDDPRDRALEIIDHHRERSEEILEILEDHGPADAWEVSAHLFGDLEGIHIVHGPGEAFAHLDHLHHEGVVSLEGDTYQVNDTVTFDAAECIVR